MKFLITSGGTVVYIDSVRKISNMSKGTFGSKIAAEAVLKDIDVNFLYAVGSKLPSPFFCESEANGKSSEFAQKIELVEYVTFDDYAARLDEQLALQPDIVILAAAVSDYGVENYVDGKLRSGEDLVIRLKPLPKLISTVRAKCPNCVLCGFKLLVKSSAEELRAAAVDSLFKNKCDLIVGNDLADIRNNDHKLTIVERKEEYDYDISYYTSKDVDLAKVVVEKCLEHYNRKKRA